MYSTEETRAHAQEVLDYLLGHPEEHNQGGFFSYANHCGTSMCIAGCSSYISNEQDVVLTNWVTDHAGKAQKSLGLNRVEAQALFFEMNEARALSKLVNITHGKEFSVEDYMTDGDGNGENLSYNEFYPNMTDYDLLPKEVRDIVEANFED